MTLLAILQAGKLRPQEGNDLRETSQSQGKAQPPSKAPCTHTRFVGAEFRQRERNPVCVRLTYFSDSAPTSEGFGIVLLIHSANLPPPRFCGEHQAQLHAG